MRKFTLLISFLVLTWSAIGQMGWTQVSTGLTTGKGIGQVSVGLLDNTALWAVAINNDGSIYDAFTKSTDGGQTWEAGTFDAGSGLSQLFAFDADVCFAVFNTGTNQGVYKTEDGGLTWVKKGSAYGTGSFANVLHFFDSMNGFVQGDPLDGYYELYTTADGGETWVRVPEANIPEPLAGEYGITGNYTAVGQNIWWGTNMARIYRSNDYGYTWDVSEQLFFSGDSTTVETINNLMWDDMNGIAFRSYLNIGYEPNFNITSDGGVTWQSMFAGGISYARYITHVPGTENTLIGSASDADAGMGISISYDGGANWDVISDGFPFQASAWYDLETGVCGTFAASDFGGMYVYGAPPAPFGVEAEVNILDVMLTWNAPAPTSFSDDFEGHGDFLLEFAPWTTIDVDGSPTYGMEEVEWPNAYDPQAFIIFNQSMTVPAVEDVIPHSGDKLAACFASVPSPTNDDWLIAPQVMVEAGAEVTFWAKSYTADYGLERFNVGVSTTDMAPASFEIITEAPYVEAPATEWTEFTFSLADYEGETVYVAINCISSDAFILLIDDFSIGTSKASFVYNENSDVVGSAKRDFSFTEKQVLPENNNTTSVRGSSSLELLGYNVYRDGSKINTAIVETEEYTDTELPVGTVEYYVTAVYDGGESYPSDTAFVIVTDVIGSDEKPIKLYPNPAYDILTIESPQNVQMVTILNSVGQMVYRSQLNAGKTSINISEFQSGVYFVQIDNGEATVTEKIIIE